MQAILHADPCRYVTLVASAQCGKTTLAEIFALGSVTMGRGLTLVAHPTIDNALRWSKLKLQPRMRTTPAAQERFPQRSREASDSLLFKMRADGLASILITGANSPASLSQITVNFQGQDDLAKWELNSAGDPETQGDNRSRAVEFAKVLKLSTPLVLPGCKITKDFEAGSREDGVRSVSGMRSHAAAASGTTCWRRSTPRIRRTRTSPASRAARIEEHHRPQMLAGFEWRAKNPAAMREHRSFYIWSAY